MIYLEKFILANEDKHWREVAEIVDYNTPDEYYPLGIFARKLLSEIDFERVTIFYGGNGSGKTTLLNLIAQKLGIKRRSVFHETIGFRTLSSLCSYRLGENEYGRKIKNIPLHSEYLCSDDIFDHILSMRENNIEVGQEKNRQTEIYYDAKYFKTPSGVSLFEHYDELKLINEARKKTKRQFVKLKAGEKERQFSNGENALLFFDGQIQPEALYMLDEPENSMSPEFQIRLKQLLEDAVKFDNCQLIIATHSPFILSIEGAKIYNLDQTPVTVEKWFELENVKRYFEFFNENSKLFKEDK